MSLQVGQTLQVTPEIVALVDVIERGIAQWHGGVSYSELIDLPKLALADAILRALELPLTPPNEKGNPPPPKRPRPGYVSFATKLAILRGDEFRCRRCGAEENLTIDHIVPKSKGGSDDARNLQTLCATCNGQKGARLA